MRPTKHINNIICIMLALLCFLGPVTPSALCQDGNENTKQGSSERSKAETVARYGAAFAATSAIKGLFGMAPGYLMTFLPSMGASLFVPALIGAGIVEGAISLTVFSAITGIKDRQYLVRAFLLASVVSVTATYFFTGLMAPWLVTLLSNTLRLVVFSMLTRPPDKDVTEHIVDEVKDVVGIDEKSDDTSSHETVSKSSLSLTDIQKLRLEAYNGYVGSSDNSQRTSYYNDFKHYSQLLLTAKDKAANDF